MAGSLVDARVQGPPDVPRDDVRGARTAAAVIGSLLCAGLLVALYALAAVPAIERVLYIRFVLGPGGFMPEGTLPQVAAWACGPLAAAIAGLALAGPALRGERWAGAWMGFTTFALTLLLASLVPDLTRLLFGQATFGEAVAGAIVGAPALAFLAGAILAPLGMLCLAAGSAWAWILRRIVTGSGRATRNTMAGGSAGVILALIVSVVLCGWVLVTSLLLPLSEGVFID